jgi:hypothetical protein
MKPSSPAQRYQRMTSAPWKTRPPTVRGSIRRPQECCAEPGQRVLHRFNDDVRPPKSTTAPGMSDSTPYCGGRPSVATSISAKTLPFLFDGPTGRCRRYVVATEADPARKTSRVLLKQPAFHPAGRSSELDQPMQQKTNWSDIFHRHTCLGSSLNQNARASHCPKKSRGRDESTMLDYPAKRLHAYCWTSTSTRTTLFMRPVPLLHPAGLPNVFRRMANPTGG